MFLYSWVPPPPAQLQAAHTSIGVLGTPQNNVFRVRLRVVIYCRMYVEGRPHRGGLTPALAPRMPVISEDG